MAHDIDWSETRFGDPFQYSHNQWHGIVAGMLQEGKEWQKEMKKEHSRVHYLANKERVKEHSRRWRATNTERENERKRNWKRSNKERDLAHKRKYKYQHLICTTCKLFRVNRKGQQCAGCGGFRVNSAEYELRDYLQDFYPRVVQNKQLEGSCLKYRPDFFLETPWGILIIEVDEAEHQDYDVSCEVVREYNIWQALGCDITFIRYNPDSYKPDGQNTQRVSKEERMAALFLLIHELYETHQPGLNVHYLWYSAPRIDQLRDARAALPK